MGFLARGISLLTVSVILLLMIVLFIFISMQVVKRFMTIGCAMKQAVEAIEMF